VEIFLDERQGLLLVALKEGVRTGYNVLGGESIGTGL